MQLKIKFRSKNKQCLGNAVSSLDDIAQQKSGKINYVAFKFRPQSQPDGTL